MLALLSADPCWPVAAVVLPFFDLFVMTDQSNMKPLSVSSTSGTIQHLGGGNFPNVNLTETEFSFLKSIFLSARRRKTSQLGRTVAHGSGKRS